MTVTLLLLVFAIFSFSDECSTITQIGVADAQTTETTCAPPTVSSAWVLALVLAVVLLLWPDISEVTVLGVSLKRHVEEARREAGVAKAEAQEAKLLLQQQSQRIDQLVAATATASAQTSVYVGQGPFYDGAEGRNQLRRSVDAIEHELGRKPELDRSLVNADDADLKLATISAWERLSETLGLGVYRRRRSPNALQDESWQTRKMQDQFISDNQERIETVRAIRNSVAHDKFVDRQSLIEGLEVARGLQELASRVIVDAQELL